MQSEATVSRKLAIRWRWLAAVTIGGLGVVLLGWMSWCVAVYVATLTGIVQKDGWDVAIAVISLPRYAKLQIRIVLGFTMGSGLLAWAYGLKKARRPWTWFGFGVVTLVCVTMTNLDAWFPDS